ncbi:response regulator [Rossellomorea sp. RS05]|uniref:response regulator n=1 Tax=Rossellomorea sp. RS05 TaxID=3149166 RepID=UPI003221B866
MISYCIVDDNAANRRMVESIIEQGGLGRIIGSAAGGEKAIELILEELPDVVLIDLLMPELDGIEMIRILKERGYHGKFVMISQINNKGMVGEAYQEGIEFFIHKPINSVEVEAVLKRVTMQMNLNSSIIEIRKSLAGIGMLQQVTKTEKPSIKDSVSKILKEMGIMSEKGSRDLLIALDILMKDDDLIELPPLRRLYEMIAKRIKVTEDEVKKETKAVEQRIRRAVCTALKNMASIGLTDYTHPTFERYAPLFFDFEDVRRKMRELEEGMEESQAKVNVKKFFQVLYLEVAEGLESVKR